MPHQTFFALAGMGLLLLTACVPSLPITPSPSIQRPAAALQRIPATVAVVVERAFVDSRFERHVSGEPGSSVKIDIGESSLESVKVVLAHVFETVGLVASAADATGFDFIVYPKIISSYSQYDSPYGDVLAVIAYTFTFVRQADQQVVQTLEVSGVGQHARSTVFVVPDFLLAISTLGSWDGTSRAMTVSRAFALAQERAFSALMSQLPTSVVATEAERLRNRR